MARRKWSSTKPIGFSEIAQQDWGTCYFLAVVPGNLTYRTRLVRRSPSAPSSALGNSPGLIDYQFRYGASRVKVRRSPLETFTRLVERSYIKFRTLLGQPPAEAQKDVIDGGVMGTAFNHIVGRFNSINVPAGQVTFSAVSNWLSAGHTVTLANYSAGGRLVKDHAYRIVGVSGDRIVAWNPWGIDGTPTPDGLDDGYISISAEEFTANTYNYFQVGS